MVWNFTQTFLVCVTFHSVRTIKKRPLYKKNSSSSVLCNSGKIEQMGEKTVARNFSYSLESPAALWNSKLTPLLRYRANSNTKFLCSSIVAPLLVHEARQTGAHFSFFLYSFFWQTGMSAQHKTTVSHANEYGSRAKQPEPSTHANIL